MNRSRVAASQRRASRQALHRRKKRTTLLASAAAVAVVAAAVLSIYLNPEALTALTSRDATASTPAPVATPVALPPATEPTIPPEPAAPARTATITVSAVGDMIFDRQVKQTIEAKGGAAPLANVADLLNKADVTVGNLESPLSSGGVKLAEKDVTFRGDPRAIEGLKNSGFDFLSLANNHVLDYGPEALADTMALLDDAGIGYAGAGMNRAEAWRPAVVERNGASVAFLSFSHILPSGFIAGESRAGLAPGRTDMDAVASAIRSAKEDHDYVLVSFHWGVEYKDEANADQVRDARTAVDAGANMVLSHHPHVIQGIEFYNGALIAYSLGDFVFDHYSRKTGEAFILDANLGPDGVTDVRVTPVYLQSIGTPKVVAGGEAAEILERLKRISGPHGTSVVIDGDTARVLP